MQLRLPKWSSFPITHLFYFAQSDCEPFSFETAVILKSLFYQNLERRWIFHFMLFLVVVLKIDKFIYFECFGQNFELLDLQKVSLEAKSNYDLFLEDFFELFGDNCGVTKGK